MIDFGFRGEARGLVMELHPATCQDALFIPEDAFGFVELCVRTAWPAYANHGHWGSTTIPSSAWREIVASMRALQASLAQAASVDEIVGIGFLFARLRDEFGADFDANRVGLSRLIDALCEWLEIWIARTVDVAIHGV